MAPPFCSVTAGFLVGGPAGLQKETRFSFQSNCPQNSVFVFAFVFSRCQIKVKQLPRLYAVIRLRKRAALNPSPCIGSSCQRGDVPGSSLCLHLWFLISFLFIPDALSPFLLPHAPSCSTTVHPIRICCTDQKEANIFVNFVCDPVLFPTCSPSARESG